MSDDARFAMLDKDDVAVLAQAFELLKGAQLPGLTGQQTVAAGQAITAFRDVVQGCINSIEAPQGGDDETE